MSSEPEHTSEIELVRDELGQRCAWLIRYRFLAAAVVIAGTLLAGPVLHLDLPVQELIASGLFLALMNEGFRRTVKRLRTCGANARSFRFCATAQFLTDWCVLLVLVHLTGGLSSPILAFFVFHAIIAAILLPPVGSYLHAAAGVFLVCVLAALEGVGLIQNRPVPSLWHVPHDEAVPVATALIAFATLIGGANHLAGSIARRLWARTREAMELKEKFAAEAARLRTLQEVASAVNSTLKLEDVLARVLDSATKMLRGKAASIRLLSDDRTTLRLAAATGLSQAYLSKGDVEVEKSPLDMAALEGWAVQIPDVEASEALQYREEALREGIRAIICAPLLVRGRATGVLRLYCVHPRTFTKEEQTFLVAIASIGATAIENARAYQRLEQLESAKSRFVYQVAHELKAPVAAVRQMLWVLDSDLAGDLALPQRDLVGRCIRRAAELQATIDDLLALGSLKQRLPEGKLVPVLLREVLEKVMERVSTEAAEKGVEVRFECSPPGLVVKADPGDMRTLFGNLLENAVKYTPPGGKVEFTATQEADRSVTIRCSDTGIGIPEEALPHLFEEFYRASNAKQAHPGNGLGLALVKRVVDLYKGDIAVESKVGEGSTFTVRLPGG